MLIGSLYLLNYVFAYYNKQITFKKLFISLFKITHIRISYIIIRIVYLKGYILIY